MSFYTDEQLSMILSAVDTVRHWQRIPINEIGVELNAIWVSKIIGHYITGPITALRELEKEGLA